MSSPLLRSEGSPTFNLSLFLSPPSPALASVNGLFEATGLQVGVERASPLHEPRGSEGSEGEHGLRGEYLAHTARRVRVLRREDRRRRARRCGRRGRRRARGERTFKEERHGCERGHGDGEERGAQAAARAEAVEAKVRRVCTTPRLWLWPRRESQRRAVCLSPADHASAARAWWRHEMRRRQLVLRAGFVRSRRVVCSCHLLRRRLRTGSHVWRATRRKRPPGWGFWRVIRRM